MMYPNQFAPYVVGPMTYENHDNPAFNDNNKYTLVQKPESNGQNAIFMLNNQVATSSSFFNNHVQPHKKGNLNKSHPKTKFTAEEDSKLLELVEKYGENNFYLVSKEMNGRNIRQCRERWRNYLSPKIENGPWTKEEDELLFKLLNQYGPKWKYISKFFPKRTDINIKSRFHVFFRRFIREKKNYLKQNLQQAFYINNNNPNAIINQYLNLQQISIPEYNDQKVNIPNENEQAKEAPKIINNNLQSSPCEKANQNEEKESPDNIYSNKVDQLFDDFYDLFNPTEFELFDY